MDLCYQLRFPESDLRKYQALYDFKPKTQQLEKYHKLGPAQGHITIAQLAEIADWKSERRPDLVAKNCPELVIELTTFAFATSNPEARMGVLTLLSGVGYPTASVISHFCIEPRDPILDERALWSLSLEKPSAYTFPFWNAYVAICRKLAERNDMTVREVDMALWKYSELYQGGLSASKQDRPHTAQSNGRGLLIGATMPRYRQFVK